MGFEFGIVDSVDPTPTRHFLLLVLLENQIQYPIEFVVAQDHALPNPSFPLQVVDVGDHCLLGSRSRDSSDATPPVPSWVCCCVGSSSFSPTRPVLTTPASATNLAVSCFPPRVGVSSIGNCSSVPNCV